MVSFIKIGVGKCWNAFENTKESEQPKENDAGNITVTDPKLYYRSIVIKHGKHDETGR